MTHENRDENVGDITEAGIVDADAPEGEHTEGSDRADDVNRGGATVEGALLPGSTASGSPTSGRGVNEELSSSDLNRK